MWHDVSSGTFCVGQASMHPLKVPSGGIGWSGLGDFGKSTNKMAGKRLQLTSLTSVRDMPRICHRDTLQILALITDPTGQDSAEELAARS